MLKFTVKKKDEILPKDDRLALERHKTLLESMVTAMTTLKESIEEKSLQKVRTRKKGKNGQQMSKQQLMKRIHVCVSCPTK